MAWNHLWSSPEILTIKLEQGSTMVPRQSCVLCGTRRNPFNNVIVYFPRDSQCRDNPERLEQKDWTDELKRVKEQLESLQRGGDRVDIWHTGRKRQRDPDTPELPLPYKD